MHSIKHCLIQAGKTFKIVCDAFAKNIVVDRKAGLGSVKFEVS